MKNKRSVPGWCQLLLLGAVFILLMTACGAGEQVFQIGDDEFQVDRAEMVIYHSGNTYSYQRQSSSGTENIEITFPDGTRIWRTNQNIREGLTGGFSGGDGPSYGEDFLLEANLFHVVEMAHGGGANVGLVLLSLVLIGAGLLDVIKPEIGWWLSTGWRFKNAEPSDTALDLARVIGIAIIIAGTILFFIAI